MRIALAVAVVSAGSLAKCIRGSRVLPDGLEFATPRFDFSPEVEGVSVVTADFNISWCEHDCQGPPPEFTIGSLTNETRVALVISSYTSECFFCGYAKLALMTQSTGAVALLRISGGVPGHETLVVQNYAVWEQARREEAVALEFSGTVRSELVAGARLELTSTTNPWRDFYATGWIACQFFLAGVNLFVAGVGLLRLRGQPRFSSAAACISLEVIASVLRAIYAAVDPVWSRGLFTYSQGRFLLSVSIPVGWLGSTVLFLAWEDLTHATLKLRANETATLSRRGRVLFISFAVCFFVVDVTLTAVAAYQGVVLAELAPLVLSMVNLVVAGLFVGAGWRFIRVLRSVRRQLGTNMSSKNGAGEGGALRPVPGCRDRALELYHSKEPAVRMTRKLVGAAVLMVVASISILLSGHDVSYTPSGRAMVFLVTFLSLAGESHFKITAFRSAHVHYRPRPQGTNTENSHYAGSLEKHESTTEDTEDVATLTAVVA